MKINFNNIIGPVKPLHGVCNSPVAYGDAIPSFKEAGIPCTVVIGSRTGKGDDFTGTAVELTEKNAAVRFVNFTQKVEGEDVIEFK